MATSEKKADAPAAPAKGGGVSVVGLVATAVFAGAAAFGGAKAADHRGSGTASHDMHSTHDAAPHVESPGFTLPLDPFLVMSSDTNHTPHPMRVVLAIEFDQTAKEETVRRFVPRIRDSALTHLRTVTYETASDPSQMDHLRSELMERFRSTGVTGVTRVLVTDLVVQ